MLTKFPRLSVPSVGGISPSFTLYTLHLTPISVSIRVIRGKYLPFLYTHRFATSILQKQLFSTYFHLFLPTSNKSTTFVVQIKWKRLRHSTLILYILVYHFRYQLISLRLGVSFWSSVHKRSVFCWLMFVFYSARMRACALWEIIWWKSLSNLRVVPSPHRYHIVTTTHVLVAG